MRRVKQKTEKDCGAACVAMLAGVTLDEAYEAVYGDGRKRVTSAGKLRVALAKLGRPPVEGRMVSIGRTTLKSLPHDALLKVQPLTCSIKHWVVWDKKRQMKLGPYPNRCATKWSAICSCLNAQRRSQNRFRASPAPAHHPAGGKMSKLPNDAPETSTGVSQPGLKLTEIDALEDVDRGPGSEGSHPAPRGASTCTR